MRLNNVGETLKKTRESLGLSIEGVSKKLRIQEKYIRAFENNDNSLFDSKVIPRGFLIKYCELLNLDSEKIVAYWRRDFVLSNKPVVKPDSPLKFVITVKIAISALFSLIIFVLFAFFVFQYFKFKTPPKLEVSNLQNEQTILSDSIVLQGITDKNSAVYINDREVKTDTDGKFTQKIFLQNGINVINLKSVSPLGATNSKTYSIKASYQEQTENFSQSGKELRVKCISAQPAFYEIKDGDKVLFSGFALKDVEKVFYGDNLYIYTDAVESLDIKFMGETVAETKDKYGKFSKSF